MLPRYPAAAYTVFMSIKPYNIALLGCGTVGSGVARLLLEQADRLAARAGRRLVLKTILVRHPHKERGVVLPPGLVTTDLHTIINDPDIHLAVEVVGGTTWARHAVLDLLAAGKDVVTANKALLATHGPEIFDAGRRHNKAIAFEASVGGGIPIIAALSQGLAANQILSLQGILNGTCNFILSSMTEHGSTYDQALAEAQKLGYAEADPTMDVDGTDTAQKLAILAQIAFGASFPVSAITRRGIANLQQIDVRFAHQLGYTIKLLAEAWLQDNQLALHVAPVLLRHQTPLAQVRDAYNAIFVVGDAVGSTLYYGRGAGQMPTASAVVADIIDLAVGRGQRTFQTMRLWSGPQHNITLRSASAVPSRFYLRLMIQDKPGALAEIARILATRHISISSVMQHEALDDQEGSMVPLVIMTHLAPTSNFTSTIHELDSLNCVEAPCVYFPVGE